ncbi:hypothetical protein Tco_0549564 [Tanacetum coccineum]
MPGGLISKSELDAFLEFLIWRFSIWVDKPTPGNALMNLRYRDERATDIRGKTCLELFYDNSVGVVELCFNVDSHSDGVEGPGLTQNLWYCVAQLVVNNIAPVRLQSLSAFCQWGDSETRSIARSAIVLQASLLECSCYIYWYLEVAIWAAMQLSRFDFKYRSRTEI